MVEMQARDTFEVELMDDDGDYSLQQVILSVVVSAERDVDYHPYGDSYATESGYEVVEGTEEYYLDGFATPLRALEVAFGEDTVQSWIETLMEKLEVVY